MYTLAINGVSMSADVGTVYVPDDPDNMDWQAYQAWVALGNQAAPLPALPVPDQVTMRQARLALLAAGKLAAVDAAIAALPSPAKEQAQIEWEYSSDVLRHAGFVDQLGAGLGLTSDQLDALFHQAVTL